MNVYLEYILPDKKEVKPAIRIPITIDSPNSVPCTVVVNRYYPIGGQSFNYFCLCSDEFGFLPEIPMGATERMVECVKEIPSTPSESIYDTCIEEANKVAEERGIAGDPLHEAMKVKNEIAAAVRQIKSELDSIEIFPIVETFNDAKEAKDIIFAIDNKKKEYGKVIETFCNEMGDLWGKLQNEMLKSFEKELKQENKFIHLMTFSVEN